MHNDVKQLLIPYYAPNLKRYGGNFDGGYILSEDLLVNSKKVYSYGIGGSEEYITFDRHMSLLNKDVYMYDETTDKFWEKEDKFFFKKEHVSSKNIYRHIQENNHTQENNMILKMDIEGGEYETFLNVDENLFTHFNQIALEVHGVISSSKDLAIKLFTLLNKNYYLVHIHGNNNDILVEDGICSNSLNYLNSLK